MDHIETYYMYETYDMYKSLNINDLISYTYRQSHKVIR